VCNLICSVSREHTFLAVSFTTLEIISWDSGISWRRLTKSRCLAEREADLFEPQFTDCRPEPGPRLGSFCLGTRGVKEVNESCASASCRGVDEDDLLGVDVGRCPWCPA
jgi:hypothetical protein